MKPPVHAILRLLMLLCSVAILQPAGVAATPQHSAAGLHRHRPAAGFDSRLWEQFYLPDPAEQSEAVIPQTLMSADRPEGRDVQFLLARSGPGPTETDTLADSLVSEQQQAEVADIDGSETVLSDWQMVKLRAAGRGPAAAVAGRSHPGATTLLVGIVAAIVVCGAMFSGRQ